MLSVSGLSKSHGGRTLFSGVGFLLQPGRRVALVGSNGVGKTTMLEILVGLQEPDAGEVSQPRDYAIGYLPQELTEVWHGSVIDEVMAGAAQVLRLEARLEELTATIANTDGEAHDRALAEFGEAQSRFEQLGGYHVEAEARRILGGLGFSTEAMDRPLAELSGGWQMRAALARLLLQKPDLLVLDEPTNHLDVDSVLWLEQQLVSWPGALLFVSHDRDFIDAVADRVIEVAWQGATEYVGGFAEFVVQREDRIRQAEAAAANQARKVAQAERFIERFRYKATKARQVQSRIKTLERLETIDVPKVEELKLRFAFPEPPRSSRVVVEMIDADLGYRPGEPVVRGVNLVIERGDKLALIGPNGAGKSTILKAIMGQLAPLAGESKIGANVDIAYFAQHQVDALDLSKTVEQEFRHSVGEQPKNRNLRTVLGSFGFSGDAVDRKVGDLSGGERTRLALAETMCNPVNLLILDEPTNHLDLPSCDVLEDALDAYPGTVLLVSHDRHLIRNVVDSVIEVRDGRAHSSTSVEELLLGPVEVPTKLSASGPSANTRKAERRVEAQQRQAKSRETRELRKRVERLERQALRADEVVEGLAAQLADPALYDDAEQLQRLITTHAAAVAKATELLEAWEVAATELEEYDARSD